MENSIRKDEKLVQRKIEFFNPWTNLSKKYRSREVSIGTKYLKSIFASGRNKVMKVSLFESSVNFVYHRIIFRVFFFIL
jgi:hypothetical protein